MLFLRLAPIVKNELLTEIRVGVKRCVGNVPQWPSAVAGLEENIKPDFTA